MNRFFQIFPHLTVKGENLTHPAPFLPVKPAYQSEALVISVLEMQQSEGFLPIFKIKRKNMTVAQPLLKGELR